jgi:hypothetical protein
MFDKKNVTITERQLSEVIPNSSPILRALRIERGELVDGKEKSSKEKISEEKEALSPTLD